MTLDYQNFPRVLPQGTTRSRVTGNYALITPDTFVPSVLPGWTNTRGVVQISPAMGAAGRGPGFLQYEAWLEKGSIGNTPGQGVERFFYVLEGSGVLTANGGDRTLNVGGYAHVPPGMQHQIKSDSTARLLMIEKEYVPMAGATAPDFVTVGNESGIPSNAFLGDDFLQLQLLLPDVAAFDMAVNIFTYTPGGTLPQVEVHVMEHGLMMLQGTGIYRLGNDWHPVRAGDVIWMGAYCEQWFCATAGPGALRVPAKYIYYKNVNRYAGVAK